MFYCFYDNWNSIFSNSAYIQYMRKSTLPYLVKMEYGWNFWLLFDLSYVCMPQSLFLKIPLCTDLSFLLLNFKQKHPTLYEVSKSMNLKKVRTWRSFKNIFPRPLFSIIFRSEMLKFHPYFILTGDTMVGFVIFCVLSSKFQKARTKIEVVLTLPCWLSQFAEIPQKL